MINPFPADESRAARAALSLLALAVATAGTVWLVDLSDAVAGARRRSGTGTRTATP
ncbi:hypothetical protein AB0880_03590 [Micromonospora chersina]|uniref:hypothetical protein n=1 Tax=Micromonospora chersina TaxID=47854 RepID=UPI00345493FC